MSRLDLQRLERGATHLHQLGPRAVAGFLGDLAARIGGGPAALALLAEYEMRLTPAMIRRAGGAKFPPRPVRAVPPDLYSVRPAVVQ